MHWAPGIPHALFGAEGFLHNSGASRRESAELRLEFSSLKLDPLQFTESARATPAESRFALVTDVAPQWR